MVRQCPTLPGARGCLICLMMVACAPFTFAASPVVVESRATGGRDSAAEGGRGPRELPFQAPVEEDGPAAGGGELLYQLQLLQEEVRTLRGEIERLDHEISRMKSIQEDRYLELDKRFQRLADRQSDSAGGGGPAPSRPMDLNVPGVAAEDMADKKTDTKTGPAEASEEQMYESALAMIRNRQYDEAISQLRQTIKQYPEGKYTPNAYYWLGEVYAAKPEPEYGPARQALAQVISFFPEHHKAADAAFKLGKVYHLMGDCERAEEILTQVIKQQKGRSVANLAESYLRDKVNCE